MTVYFMEWDDQAAWGSRERQFLSLLSPLRQKACMQYRFLADRNRSLYSALLLRVLLCREYGTEWNTLQFEKSRYG